MQVRRVIAFCAALLVTVAGLPAQAQRNNNNQQRGQQTPPTAQRPLHEQADVNALLMGVDMVAAGQPTPKDIGINWESNHFVKGQSGDTYIPFSITVDRAALSNPAVAFYVRIVDKNAPAPAAPAAPAAAPAQGNNRNQAAAPPAPAPAPTPTYAWSNLHFIEVPQDGKLSRAVQLKPGEYTMYMAIKERTPPAAAPANQRNDRDRNRNQQQQPPAAAAPAAPAKIGVLMRDLSVPDYNVSELRSSSVILARTVEPLTSPLAPTEQEANPYVFGPMRIVPNMEGRYSKKDELNVIFWIYGTQATAQGKPDVTVEYNFHTRSADGGEKYFNRTAPQALNAETLPPEFNVAAGHQLPGSLVVPLASFPAGDYRLEIKITDKPSGKVVTQNVNFTVLPV